MHAVCLVLYIAYWLFYSVYFWRFLSALHWLISPDPNSIAARSSSKIQIIAGNSSYEPAKDMGEIRNIVPNKDSIIHLFPKEY